MRRKTALIVLVMACTTPSAIGAQGYNADILFSGGSPPTNAPIAVGTSDTYRRQNQDGVGRTAERHRTDRAQQRADVHAAQTGGTEVRHVEIKTESGHDTAKGVCHGRNGQYVGLATASRKHGETWASWHFTGKGGASADGAGPHSLHDALSIACRGG